MKNALIVVNTHKEESLVLGNKVQAYLNTRSINASLFSFDGFSDEYPFEGYDFVVTLGGDGTVLFAARGCAKLGIPVFPVNLGEFGFIASVQKEDWQRELELFLNGKARLLCE